jgi:hypothetical protein
LEITGGEKSGGDYSVFLARCCTEKQGGNIIYVG